jgi:hypothetical protein
MPLRLGADLTARTGLGGKTGKLTQCGAGVYLGARMAYLPLYAAGVYSIPLSCLECGNPRHRVDPVGSGW